MILVKTVNGAVSKTASTTVTFTPPVACQINYPDWNSNTNYDQNPLTVTGTVNNPAADVDIYENSGIFLSKAVVQPDGTFKAQVHLVEISGAAGFNLTAEASFENEIASDYAPIGFRNGKIYSIPSGPGPSSELDILPSPTINLKEGNTATLDCVMNIQSDNYIPLAGETRIVRVTVQNQGIVVDNNGHVIEQPAIPGLSAKLEPSGFTLYCTTRYHCTITITASTDVPPGEYYFEIPVFAGNTIAVNVEP